MFIPEIKRCNIVKHIPINDIKSNTGIINSQKYQIKMKKAILFHSKKKCNKKSDIDTIAKEKKET